MRILQGTAAVTTEGICKYCVHGFKDNKKISFSMLQVNVGYQGEMVAQSLFNPRELLYFELLIYKNII